MNTFFQNFKQWCLKVSVSSIIFISVIILGGTIITAALPSSLNNLTSQASPPHQLTAEKWNNLLTYVGDLTDTITTLSGTISTLSSTLSILSDENQTLSGELANLKNQEFSGFEQVPLGTIIATNGSTSKTAMNADGWALCDGSSIASQVSGAAIGGYTPNLAGKTLVGAGNFGYSTTFNLKSDNSYTYSSTTYNGEVRHSLSISEMPSHSHTVNSFTDRENGDDSSSSAQEVKGAGLKNTSSIGGGQAHNNMPPFYVINYYMKVKSNFETALSGICSGQTYTAYNQINISVPELVDGQTYVYNDSTSSSKKYTRAITIKCSNGTLSHTIGNPQCTSSDYSYDYYLDSCGAKCTYTYSPSYMMSTSCSVYSSNSSTTYHGYTVSATASTCTCQGPYNPKVCIDGKWYDYSINSTIQNNSRVLKDSSQISGAGSTSYSQGTTYYCEDYNIIDDHHYSTAEAYCNSFTNEFVCNGVLFSPSSWNNNYESSCHWNYTNNKCQAGYHY